MGALLSPEALSLILKYVQLGIAAAPDIAAAVVRAKDFIQQLFTAKLITATTQTMLHDRIDAVAAVFLDSQNIPSNWKVEADPVA